MHIAFCSATDPAELCGQARRLKFGPCPHCRRVGHLLGHGTRKGYTGDHRATRAYRLYCSNRRSHEGCGRTFSLMPAHVVPRRVVGAAVIFALLVALVSGLSMRQAWTQAMPGFSLSTARRLGRALGQAQPAIRARLCAEDPEPPPDSASASPLAQTLDHLRRRFAPPECPVHGFQLRFQTSFL